MSDYKQTRDAAGNVTSQYGQMLRNLDDDLVERLRSKIIAHTDAAVWMLEAADRIEELGVAYVQAHPHRTERRNRMTWHYQLMKHTEPDGEVWYGIHELYEGNGYTLEPESVTGHSKEDVKWVLQAMLGDIEKHGVKDYE